ncbi:DUF6582 domain-containing protein [Streptomyces mirabilis]|uniref:DUF6582 domain-containing protein n=1 Tax=Streptomyces mirabilis TaxID=68239 RepID=UPI0036D022F6
MAARIGTITGIALVPGVSRNGRLYTAEAIGRAVKRAQARIDEDAQPLTMLSHHDANDDSRQIVGRIRSITQLDDGRAAFSADLADTEDGRTIASLVDNRDGKPFLRGVSIRGAWVGEVRRVPGPNGELAQSAEDLELDGLDFTRKPGVLGAQIDTFTPAEAASAPAETAPDGRVLITESVQEALVTATIEEADAPKAETPVPGGGPYADPGYQADKKKRYPIDTRARAKAAWSYVNQADNARLYTSAQLKRIKQRITKALKGFGVTVATAEGWLIDPASAVTEALAECWDMDVASPQGSLYVSLTNGPTTVTVSSTLLDAHDLMSVGRAAMVGALGAAAQIDPDMDGDIDVPGAPGEDTDDGIGSSDGVATAAGTACPCGCGCAIPETPGSCPCDCQAGECLHCMGEADDSAGDGMETALETPAPETPAAETTTQEKEPAMAESTTTPAAETPGSTDGIDALGQKIDKLSDALAGFVTAMTPAAVAAESAPAETVAEAAPVAPVVAETEDQRIARLVAEGIAAAMPKAIQEHVETTGGPARKGLVAPVTEHTAPVNTAGLPDGWPDKPLHEYTDEEFRQHVSPATVKAVFGNRVGS